MMLSGLIELYVLLAHYTYPACGRSSSHTSRLLLTELACLQPNSVEDPLRLW